MAAQGELKTEGSAEEYSRAFLVGWRLAQLYARPSHSGKISAVFTKAGYLPEIPENFTPPQQANLVWTNLKGDLEALPGSTSKESEEAITALSVTIKDEQYTEAALATGISRVYENTLKNVIFVHPQLAKAIVLGRQLTDLVVGPANGTVTFQEQLDADLVKSTCVLLDDLQSCFPKRAAAAVSGSLVYWQQWAAESPAEDTPAVREQLRRQGEQWRSLLTGEIDPDDLLGLHDYRQAFMDYVGQVGWLCQQNPWLWVTAAAVILGGAGGIACIVEWAPKGAAVIAAIIATAAGALGITWKTIAVTASKAATLLERPMLDRGLSDAVKFAAFIQPAALTPGEIAELRKKVTKELSPGPEQQRPAGWIKRILQPLVHKPTIAVSAGRAAPAPKATEAPTEPAAQPDAKKVGPGVATT
jgi:hypothetical protein